MRCRSHHHQQHHRSSERSHGGLHARGGWGGRRMRRGDVRAAILLLLGEGPRNGYQVMQELEERSDGVWRPSPARLSRAAAARRRRARPGRGPRRQHHLRADRRGPKHLEENRESFGVPWQQAEEGVPGDVRDLLRLAMSVGIATRQVIQTAETAQRKEAAEILADTRRRLYGILARRLKGPADQHVFEELAGAPPVRSVDVPARSVPPARGPRAAGSPDTARASR